MIRQRVAIITKGKENYAQAPEVNCIKKIFRNNIRKKFLIQI